MRTASTPHFSIRRSGCSPARSMIPNSHHDPELAAATCRAYNRWLADYCSAYPDRLFGIAMLPLQSVELAVAEMRFAKKELGFHGGFIRPNPYSNKMVHDPMYEPFWAAAEDLDFAIGFHEGAGGGM
ncbi:MAG: amidohydrolase family protein, partial [Alphaproteobacteria bacterium]|nr:amidohydrolase family protein [Alphaproteobacteria bacterium]